MAPRKPEAAAYLWGVAIAKSNANGLDTRGLTKSLETLASELRPQLYRAAIGQFVARFGNQVGMQSTLLDRPLESVTLSR